MTTTSIAAALLRGARPRQWLKNTLVAAAPLAGGVLLDPAVLVAVLGSFVAFTLCASGVYLLNDLRDVEADRLHERKRRRPIASGALPVGVATSAAIVLLPVGLLLGAVIDPALGATLAVYVVLQAAYSWGLKDQPVIDLAVVASGFLLRAIAGGVAANVEPSQWFLLVTSFGALFVVAGKRYSELRSVGALAGTRRSLSLYSESYLRFVWSLAASVAVTAYSLWAFEMGRSGDINWQAMSIVPFVLALLRYAVDVDRGLAGEPEDAVLRDPVLLMLVGCWLAVFAAGVYGL